MCVVWWLCGVDARAGQRPLVSHFFFCGAERHARASSRAGRTRPRTGGMPAGGVGSAAASLRMGGRAARAARTGTGTGTGPGVRAAASGPETCSLHLASLSPTPTEAPARAPPLVRVARAGWGIGPRARASRTRVKRRRSTWRVSHGRGPTRPREVRCETPARAVAGCGVEAGPVGDDGDRRARASCILYGRRGTANTPARAGSG